MYALPANVRFYFSALLYLQKIIHVASLANRLFSVPRCVRTAAELNRLVHDRVNLRTVVSRDKTKKKPEEKTKGTRRIKKTRDIVFETLGFAKSTEWLGF